MKLKDIIPYAVIISLCVYMYFDTQDVDVIDNTKYYEAEKDSLESLNHLLHQGILKLDSTLKIKDDELDSLFDYQNKIYKYYADEIRNIKSIPDSAVYSTFSRLLIR